MQPALPISLAATSINPLHTTYRAIPAMVIVTVTATMVTTSFATMIPSALLNRLLITTITATITTIMDQQVVTLFGTFHGFHWSFCLSFAEYALSRQEEGHSMLNRLNK